MSEPKPLICRLCKSTEFLSNLYEVEGKTNLLQKVHLCIGIEIYPGDGLPSMICKLCKKMIHRFHTFKQNCLKVNSDLNIIKQLSETPIKIENYIQTNTELTVEFESSSLNNYTSTCNMKINSVQANGGVSHCSDKNCINYNKDDTSQNSIQCELCGSIYKSKIEYKTHLSSHSETRLYQCKLCNKHFTRAESRKIHMRAHLGIRPFICEICGKSSTKRQDLTRHMKIHSEERNFECGTCGRRFKRSTDLYSHNRTHTGARPYKCNKCGKGYTSHSGLRKHNKSNIICKEPDMKS